MIEIGQKFLTNEGCTLTVIGLATAKCVRIKFLDEHGYEKNVTATNIRNGEIKNPYHKSVFGIGYFGVGDYRAKVGDVTTYEYVRWKGMLGRCYDSNVLIRQPCYADCLVENKWHNFQTFADWITKQIGYGNKGWQLDKDLLVPGNKMYSEDVCVLVPQEINALFTGGNLANSFPRGVFLDERVGKFVAQCRYKKKIYRIGAFSNAEDASVAYKEFKKKALQEIAKEHKESIDKRVYEILMEYPDHAI